MVQVLITVFGLSLLVLNVFCQTTTNGPTKEPLPVLPVNPTLGGKLGNPGSILRLTKNMLFKDVQKACRDAERKRPEDRSFSDFTMPTADGRIVIGRPRIASLTLPVLIADLVAPKTISWVADNSRMTVMATWTYLSNNNSINYTGQVYIPPTMFNAAVNTTMGRNAEMQPAITSSACKVDVADFKVSFTTPNVKARQIIDEVQTNLTKHIRDTLESDMCDLLSSTLQFAINKLLSSFQTKYELSADPKIVLDYSLIADPFVDQDCSISMWLKGMMSINGRNMFTFYPHDMSHQNKSSKMIDIMFSDYILNSLLQSSYQSELLQFAFNSNSSSKATDVLRDSCDEKEVCLGKVFPLVKDYPNEWYPEVVLSATRPPTAIFQNGAAYMQAYAFMKMDMRQANTLVRTNLVSAPISTIVSLMPKVGKDPRFITMDAKIATLKMDVAHPKQQDIVSLLKPIVEELMNNVFNRGIPIPMFMMKMLHFHNSALSLFDRSLLFQTDFHAATLRV